MPWALENLITTQSAEKATIPIIITSDLLTFLLCQHTSATIIKTEAAFYCPAGESVSILKHVEAIPDPRAVNQDKKNMLFSVSLTRILFILTNR